MTISARNTVISWARSQSATGLPPPSAAIGGSKINSTGAWTCNSSEEACRTRKDHSAENLALIRRLALNLLSHHGLPRNSIRRRKRRAALNDEYRLRLLFGQPSPAAA